MPLDPNARYNANLFAIAPEGYKIILQQACGTSPLIQKNYKVYNIGKTEIFVELLYGAGNKWQGVLNSCSVEPGEMVILDNKGKKCHNTGLKISNSMDIRAIIHASTTDGIFPAVVPKEPGLFDSEYHRKLKEFFSIGVKYTPNLKKKFRGLLDAFWPTNKPNIWEQIEEKLQPFLENYMLHLIRGMLDDFLKNIGDRIHLLNIEFEQGKQAAECYMRIAQDLKGIERSLFNESITCAERLGLTRSNINFIHDQIEVTIKGSTGATKRISDLLNEWVQMVYKNCHPADIYNTMMTTRSLIALHGVEYSRIWDNMVQNPSTTGEKSYNDVISYSTFFGRPTANLYREAMEEPMEQPLTPYLAGFKRNCISSVDIFLYRNSSSASPKIGGARIIFENGNVHVMGTETEDVGRIYFNGERILKMVVTGDGAIDSCTFFMSDKRRLFFGTRESETLEEAFELKDHHIVSFVLSADSVILAGQATNIAVAYRLNDNFDYE